MRPRNITPQGNFKFQTAHPSKPNEWTDWFTANHLGFLPANNPNWAWRALDHHGRLCAFFIPSLPECSKGGKFQYVYILEFKRQLPEATQGFVGPRSLPDDMEYLSTTE